VARPLYKLTEIDRTFSWNNECQEAFDALKKALTTASYFNFLRKGSDGNEELIIPLPEVPFWSRNSVFLVLTETY
jgi:hypothetical protein